MCNDDLEIYLSKKHGTQQKNEFKCHCVVEGCRTVYNNIIILVQKIQQ